MRKNKALQLEVYRMKNELTIEEQIKYNERLITRKKSKGLAYLFYFTLGYFGVHRFYLGRIKYGLFAVGSALAALFVILTSDSNSFVWSFILSAHVITIMIDLIYTNIMFEDNFIEIQYDILKKLLIARGLKEENFDESSPREIMKDSPQVLSELSLNNNRLFSLKGNIRNDEIRLSVENLYDVINSVIALVKKGDIEGKKLDKIARFYLPQLISILNNYESIEISNYSSNQVSKTIDDIKLIIKKIEQNIVGIIRESNLQKREEINLELEVLKKVMAIEGFDGEDIY